MQAITFPFDSSSIEHAATRKSGASRNGVTHLKSGTIRPCEYQEIVFIHGGELSHDKGKAFAKDFPQGYCAGGSVAFASAASSTLPAAIELTFADDVNNDIYQFSLTVIQ
ncbi:MAG: hypothetical protein NVSMB62_07520 [Acidobacteriaceae bacterium]